MHSIIELHIQPEAQMSTTARKAGTKPPLKSGPDVPEAPRKKNYRLRQSKIDRAREILGTKTETETIEQALDMIAFQREMLDGIDALYGAGVVNVFDEDPDAEVRD
jgi:hypothetical protein